MKTKDRKDRQIPPSSVPIPTCQVCFLKLGQADAHPLTCSHCAATVHRACYHSDFEEKGKNKFKCDQCKFIAKNRQAKLACSMCGADRGKGLLKNVGNEEWMHVLCALSSPRARLASYGSLAFMVEGQPSKKLKAATRCVECNNDRSAGLPCWVEGCTKFAHLNCIIQPKGEQQDTFSSFLTIGLLDHHQDSLLAHLKGVKELNLKGLSLYHRPQHLPNDPKYFVCGDHNSDEFFTWCACGEQATTDRSFECEICKRWYHEKCSPSEKHCKGCIDNNIFTRMASLPELLSRAAEIQKVSTPDKTHIKFLDHFSLKLSEELIKAIGRNTFDVERYYLRKALEKMDAEDPGQVDNAVEMIYYLTKRELKAKQDIAPVELEAIIQSFEKENRFEWNKAEKVEKKFKNNLEALLQAIRRDGTREIKSKLLQFIKRNRQSTRTHQQISSDLSELIRAMQLSEGWRQGYSFPSKDPQKHLIQFFYQMKLAPDDIAAMLSAIRTISNPSKGALLQSDLNAISPIFQRTLPDPKRKVFQSVFEGLTKGLSLRRGYKQKQQLRQSLQQKMKTSKGGKQRENIKATILGNRLLITPTSPLMQIERDSIAVAVFKRKMIRKFMDPSPEELNEALECLHKLMEIDSRSQTLEQRQRKEFQNLQLRLGFYDRILKAAANQDNSESSPLPSASPSPSSDSIGESQQQKQGQNNPKKITRPTRSHTLREQAMAILLDWRFDSKQSITIALNQANKLSLHRVEFQQKQRETIQQFCQGVLEYYNRSIEEGVVPTGQLLEKLHRVIRYCSGEDKYSGVLELYAGYHAWKQDLDSLGEIPLAIETLKNTQRVLALVERKLEEAEGVGLELGVEIRKLKVVRLWAQLSLKLQACQRPTIASVQATRTLMDRIGYPSNCLRRRIETLQAESRSLNKRINLFLEKPKVADLQIFQQLKLMAGKMTLSDGLELQRDLELSELDVEVELQELVEEIKDFKSFPKDLSGQSLHDLEALLALRRRLLENSFKLQGEGLQDYYQLLCKITRVKCQEYQPGAPINKKEYFKYITSGLQGAQLFSETQVLYRGYKEVQKAEKEILSAKPKYQNLLPLDLRRLRQDLRDDPAEVAKVTHWSNLSTKIRQRYSSLRSTRTDINAYIAIEQQLLRLPIKNLDILGQINALRRELQGLTEKVRAFLEGNDPVMIIYQSPYASGLLDKYRSLNVRNEYLDRFQLIFNRNRSIMQFAKFPTPEKYARFRQDCQEYGQLVRNSEVYRARQVAFYRMSQLYLQSLEPLMEVGCMLFGEGGFLMRYPAKVDMILPRIIQIHGKFNKWDPAGRREEYAEGQRRSGQEEEEDDGDEEDENKLEGEGSVEEEQQDEDEDQLMNDQDDSSQEEDIDELIDDLDQDDSFRSQSSSSQRRTRKRPPPANEVVQLDDD